MNDFAAGYLLALGVASHEMGSAQPCAPTVLPFRRRRTPRADRRGAS